VAQEKVPAFQFYPKDFLSDTNVLKMSHTERGLYITLMASCWMDGALPNNTKELAQMVKMPAPRFERLWQGPLGCCFYVNGDGRLHHKRLDAEREKQEQYRRRQSRAAASRWDKPK
jgi:uncharacterized protein YdaU (DUF1376 family)